VAIVVIQPLMACHNLSVFNTHAYISVFQTYVWLTKQACYTFVNFVVDDEKSIQKFIEKVWRNF